MKEILVKINKLYGLLLPFSNSQMFYILILFYRKLTLSQTDNVMFVEWANHFQKIYKIEDMFKQVNCVYI